MGKDIFDNKIALTLSGGGGRAAGFHLGTLSYLDHLDILQYVSTLSSVSGGTFTAARYVLALTQAPEGEDRHTTFQQFFDKFHSFLCDAHLVRRALDRLAAKPPGTPSKSRTLVKALADVYDKDKRFMNGARFETILSNRKKTHLDNIIFNATDCRNGIAFRFQSVASENTGNDNSQWPSGNQWPIGNQRIWIESQHAGALRMADIVATSSDIPVGLEPMIFPSDFVWPTPESLENVQSHLSGKCKVDSVALMDGGIIDNQGVDGALRANQDLKHPPNEDLVNLHRLHDAVDIALLIVSDAPFVSSDIYDPKPESPNSFADRIRRWTGHVTFGGLRALLWLLFVLSLLTAAVVIAHAIVRGPALGTLIGDVEAFFLYLIPLALVGTVLASLFWFRLQTGKLFAKISSQVLDAWRSLKRLSLNDVIRMISLRVGSTWALTSTIFLNRIRKLVYEQMYSITLAPDVDHELSYGSRNLPIACEIYALTEGKPGLDSKQYTEDYEKGQYPGKKPDVPVPRWLAWLQPTTAMHDLATRASELQTTLWLNKNQLDDLVACGQVTACYCILQHFVQILNPNPHLPIGTQTPGDQPLTPYFKQALKDWELLKEDPYALLPSATSRKGEAEKPTARSAGA